ncbi:MAG: hypothetical protein IH860_00070 [Chloroflexi bacterium]|nr:hypothetical protein [Chloroflexota bacterium]
MGVYGHIIESPGLREECLEPRYGDRAIALRKDESGLGSLEMAGNKAKKLQGDAWGLSGLTAPPLS